MSEGKDLADLILEVGGKPLFKELSKAGYTYVADQGVYMILKPEGDTPVIYYDLGTDTVLPMVIVEQLEAYMNN